MSRPTLITGASGFAGSHLVDRLAGGTPIIAWHRPGKTPPAGSAQITWQPVDVTDADEVARAMADSQPARVYHLAGVPRVDTAWRDVAPHLSTNVLGTHHLLEAMRRGHQSCRALVISSGMVYQPQHDLIQESAPRRPSNPYGLSKLAQEELALRAADDDGLDVVVARPFNHSGPRQDPGFAVPAFARQIARIEAGQAEAVIHVGNLDARRDLTDVRDVAAAYELLMERGHRGSAYNVCSGQAVRIGDVLDQLLALSRVQVRVVVDADRLRPSDAPVLAGDSALIRAETGWQPARSIADMLKDTLDWWRAHVK